MPAIQPKILVWARTSAGLGLDDAAKKIGLRVARGLDPAERLAALELGESSPTRAQLAKMAKVYRRPLVVFYLSAPPQKGERGSDFRTGVGDVEREEAGWLDAVIRGVRTRPSFPISISQSQNCGTRSS